MLTYDISMEDVYGLEIDGTQIKDLAPSWLKSSYCPHFCIQQMLDGYQVWHTPKSQVRPKVGLGF